MKFNWKRRVIHYGCGFRDVSEYIAEECKQTIRFVGMCMRFLMKRLEL